MSDLENSKTGSNKAILDTSTPLLVSGGGIEVGIGWLDGSSRTMKPQNLRDILTEFFGPETREGPKTGFYEHCTSYDLGRVHIYTGGKAGAKGTTRIEVTQSALDGLGFIKSIALIKALRAEEWIASRSDLWIDDHGKHITPSLAREAFNNKQVVSHAHPGRFVENDEDGTSTYYLGSPASDRRLRFYDRRGPVRSELQSRRSFADWQLSLIEKADHPEDELRAQITSFVDFRIAKARKNGTRSKRLDWWEAIVGPGNKAEPAPERPKLALEELAQYVMIHWSRTLAELAAGMPDGFLEDLLLAGQARLQSEKIDEMAQELGIVDFDEISTILTPSLGEVPNGTSDLA